MRKRRILCYGDSNTWGYMPAEGTRYQTHERWTGVLADQLGGSYEIIEEGLNGRTTVLEDPVWPGRNGLSYLEPCLFSHEPLDLVILMLGTNDLKHRFGMNAHEVGMAVRMLIQTVQKLKLSVLLISPIYISEVILTSPYAKEFDGLATCELSKQLAGEYRQAARELGAYFIDASQYAYASPKDGIHMEEDAHNQLGIAFAEKIQNMLDK